MMKNKSPILILLFLFSSFVFSQTDIYDSGGSLMPEQAAYDVHYYDLDVSVNPADSTINGSVGIKAGIVQPIDYFVVDLDTLLGISKILEIDTAGKETERHFNRQIGKVWIALEWTRQPGESVNLRIYYGGKPRIAVRPPWDGGFTWAKTADGSPWIATTCQGEGPDIWWPAKDHVSDEPDSMGIHIRVPDPLVCASNGKLLSVEHHDDNTSTYNWFVSTPINNYDVALNIAPYKLIEEKYTSTCGDVFPFKFWVLPEDYEKGKKIFPEFMEHMHFMETILGPYPFRADKYGVAETPHLGMEHQTIIAYGASFNNGSMTGGKDWGFDALHHHELSHEWFGNLVTNADWKDMWIHEGFGTYMQALYLEYLNGMSGYHDYMNSMRNFGDKYAVASRKSMTASEIYKAPIYSKGAWVLHTLRYLIGDDLLKKSLRRMAYPDPAMEKITDGRQTRFATTNDYIHIVKGLTGKDLEWFFDVYVYQPLLPQLQVEIQGNKLHLSWNVPGDLPFPMPIDVKIGKKTERVQIPPAGVTLNLNGEKPEIDPDRWVLFDPAGLKEGLKDVLNGDLENAKTSYEKVLVVDAENKTALKMLGYLNYAQENKNKIESGFFDKYVGAYAVSPQRIWNISKEGNDLFIHTRGMKFKLYPVSDSEFSILEYNVTYTFVTKNDVVKEMTARVGDRTISAQRVK